MRTKPFILGALAILLLAGAASPTSCTIPWQALLGGLNTGGDAISVHVINDAFQAVQFSLTSSTTTNAAATAPATQPDGSTLDKGGEYDTTFACDSIPAILACKATLVETDGTTGQSATSETLHKDADYSCGSTVTFTVRSAARVGIVVGAAAD